MEPDEHVTPTIKNLIPARLKVDTTEGISSRGGSTIPTRPTNVRPDRAWDDISFSKRLESGVIFNSSFLTIFRASKMTRLPSADQPFLISSIFLRTSSSRAFELPSIVVYVEHLPIKMSGAPLMVSRLWQTKLVIISHWMVVSYVSSEAKLVASSLGRA